jgi:transposase InsO family protein
MNKRDPLNAAIQISIRYQFSPNDRTPVNYAADVIRDICRREGIIEGQMILHSDNGSPMKGATMLATLQQLGVMPSLSRPSVSNDNPYSEALFKTPKYRPDYPARHFAELADARRWVEHLAHWY